VAGTGSAGDARLERWAARAAAASAALNLWVERACVGLAVILVVDVWLGVLFRYVLPFNLTFTEEAARYLMIWMALLAVSCGIARREHIGVLFLFDALPTAVRHGLLLVLDLIAIGFFLFLFVYGIGFAVSGAAQVTMLYGASKVVPFASVPVATGLAVVQLALVMVRDQARLRAEPGRTLA